MSTNGWEQLDCRYFAETCREVLGDYLENHGFKEKRLTNGGGIVYGRFDLFLEVSYDTNLFPKYTTRVVVGFGDGAYNKQGGFSGVPMWYIIPQDHPYRTRVHWTFSSKDELAKVLEEVKTEFLETTLVPLLLNRDGLERIIGNFRSEFCC
jgi:hypothetical protein